MPDAPIDIDNQVTVTQLRAQWTTPSFGAGESSWSFIQPAANPDYQLSVLGPWVDHLLPLFRAARPMGWRLNTIRVEDRWPSLRAAIIVEDGWGPIPDTDVQGLPPQCTPVISWRTGIIGRSNRGRTYWGPIKLTDCEYSNVLGDGDTASTGVGLADLITGVDSAIQTHDGCSRFVTRSHIPTSETMAPSTR
jgi:hypothetical protein